jgi:hypothetical protein
MHRGAGILPASWVEARNSWIGKGIGTLVITPPAFCSPGSKMSAKKLWVTTGEQVQTPGSASRGGKR